MTITQHWFHPVLCNATKRCQSLGKVRKLARKREFIKSKVLKLIKPGFIQLYKLLTLKLYELGFNGRVWEGSP